MSLARLMQMARAGVPAGDVWTDPDLANASYDSVSFSVAGQDSNPRGIAFNDDGTKLFMVGLTTDAVYQYSLSTAYDLSTTSYDSVSFSVSSQDLLPIGISFNADGTKMFILGDTNDTVYQYSLSTGFDLSTASYDSVSFSVSSQDSVAHGIDFSTDGTKMFISGDFNDTVYQYSLSTGFDLSTASYDSVSFAVGSQDVFPESIRFNPDGTKMFLVGRSNDTIFQYSLTTAYDLSTASYDSISFSVTTQLANPRDVIFKNDGSKMYVTGSSSDAIFQYST